MGGRGSTSQLRKRMPQQPQQQTAQNPIQQQPPTPDNTPVVNGALTALSQMSDDQLATLMANSKTVDMPNHLNDAVDATQKFAYTAGVNEMPTVLDDSAFDQFLKDNNIPKSNILSRSVSGVTYNSGGIRYNLTATDITDMMKYSTLNYVGGKHGGQVYGAGTYFDMNGGMNTGYHSGATALAVLNPKTAHCIDKGSLQSMAATFAQSHPKFAKQVGRISNSTLSIYALAMGYNVITDSKTNPSYHNVIDRKAIVYRKSNL